MIRPGEDICPDCGEELKYYDKIRRIVRFGGSEVECLKIRRYICLGCGRVHNELPKMLIPFKQYSAEVIRGFIFGDLTSDDLRFEDYPCEAINDYPVIHVYELECDNCSVGQQEDGGGTVTEEIARARMKQQAEELLENGCDKPKIEMSVEFINLGDTEEYKQFRNLENCFLYDYVIVQHPTMDIDVTAQIMEIEWDCLLDRMVSMEIGSVGKTLANTGITSWQIPNGFSGSKIAGGSIPGGALQSDIISVRHMQAESINTEALQAACVTAVKIAAGAIEANHISVEAIDAVLANIDTAVIEKAEIDWAEIASLAAEIANIAKAQITEANINQANINWANIANLTATVSDIANAIIEDATISSAQIDDLAAVVAQLIHAEVGTGEFDLAEIENLLASAFILEQGAANSMMIKNLVVTDANLLNANGRDYFYFGEDRHQLRSDIL